MNDLDLCKPVIGVIGSDGLDGQHISENAYGWALNVGRLIAERGGMLLTSGGQGVLLAASQGANLAGGIVIGLLPGNSKSNANPYVTIPLATNLGNVASTLIVRACDAVIMICGSDEAFHEAIVSYGRKPLIILEGTGGWADRMRQTLYQELYFDEPR